VSGVTEALVRDHRTDVAVVGITDRDGVITLEGQVGDPDTRAAAEEIARQQPGVLDVVNRLEVRIEDVTELPEFRPVLLDKEEAQARSRGPRIDG
jgi:hypothetical protein